MADSVISHGSTPIKAVNNGDNTYSFAVEQPRKTLTIVTGTKTASGDNELIAAPGAGVSIVVAWFTIQNESSTATTMLLREGTTAKERVFAQNQGDGLSRVYPPDARWKLAANTALNLNLSGANQCGYTVGYYTE